MKWLLYPSLTLVEAFQPPPRVADENPWWLFLWMSDVLTGVATSWYLLTAAVELVLYGRGITFPLLSRILGLELILFWNTKKLGGLEDVPPAFAVAFLFSKVRKEHLDGSFKASTYVYLC